MADERLPGEGLDEIIAAAEAEHGAIAAEEIEAKRQQLEQLRGFARN